MSEKVLFLTSIPSPYQVDFFNALQERVPSSFCVVFSAAQEVDRQYYKVPDSFDFSAIILNRKIRKFGKDLHRNSELLKVLRRENADTIVVGGSYFMPDALLTRKYCVQEGKRFYFWGENPMKKRDGFAKRILKENYLTWFLKPVSGVIGYGDKALFHYQRLAKMKPGVSIPYSPDLSSLLNPSQELVRESEALREMWGRQSAGETILYAGSLISRKDPKTLIEAFARIHKIFPGARLKLAGDGPMRKELENLVSKRGLAKKISFLGFLQEDALRAAYLASDIFVLPTCGHEGWGVVVQEALAAGLPVIASSRVGAAQDLIKQREVGRLFSPGSVEDLGKNLSDLIRERKLRSTISLQARQVVAATSSKAAAKRMVDFLELSGQSSL